MPKPYIIMPESHWVNALDAVREKTGTTGTISSEELAAEIGRISGSGIDTSDATATADKIFKDESAYVDGEKLIGTFTIDSELTEQDDLISQISTLVAQKAMPPSTDTSDATATALDIAENKSAYVNGEKVEGALYDYRGNTDFWVSLTDSYQWSDNDQAVKFEIDDLGIFDSNTVFKMDGGELASGIGLTADKIAEGETIMGIEGTHSGGGGGGGSVETSIVTINIALECIYLGTDLQPKQEVTSTFEAVKNSIAYISAPPTAGSGYTVLVAQGSAVSGAVAIQLTETTVNIFLSLGGGGAD